MKPLFQSRLTIGHTLYERLLDNEDVLVSGMDDTIIKTQLYNIYDEAGIRSVTIKNGKDVYIDGDLFIVRHDITTLEIPGITIKHITGNCELPSG